MAKCKIARGGAGGLRVARGCQTLIGANGLWDQVIPVDCGFTPELLMVSTMWYGSWVPGTRSQFYVSLTPEDLSEYTVDGGQHESICIKRTSTGFEISQAIVPNTGGQLPVYWFAIG